MRTAGRCRCSNTPFDWPCAEWTSDALPDKGLSIAYRLLTDSDDTKSGAQGGYANFRVCRG